MGKIAVSKIKTLVLFSFLILQTLGSVAQGTAVIQKKSSTLTQLRVGDKMPDLTFEKVLNYKKGRLQFSSINKRLILLDFWSTYCTSCIAEFPKMERIQSKYDSEIQILLVNPHGGKHDSEERINKILDLNSARTGFYPKLPMPILDTILNSIFPHKSVPLFVWITNDRKIIAITGSVEVTEKNIESVLKGNELNLAEKNDKSFVPYLPLLVEGNGGSSSDFIFRSLLTKYNGAIGFNGGPRYNSSGKISGYYNTNVTLFNIITMAYPDLLSKQSASRIINETALVNLLDSKFDPSNAFCYDITFPPIPPDSLTVMSKYFRNDLNTWFNISVYETRREIPTLIFRTRKKIEANIQHNQALECDINLEEASKTKFIRNCSLSQIVKIMEFHLKQPVILDALSEDVKLTINFPLDFDLSNRTQLLSFLKEFGFDIIESNKEINVVVITDK